VGALEIQGKAHHVVAFCVVKTDFTLHNQTLTNKMSSRQFNKKCRDGVNCKRPGCGFKHPNGYVAVVRSCKFGDTCCWTPESCPGGGHVPCPNGNDCSVKDTCGKDHRDLATLDVYQPFKSIDTAMDIWTNFLDKDLTMTEDEWLDTRNMSSPDRNMLEKSLKEARKRNVLVYAVDVETRWTDEPEPVPIEDKENTYLQVWFRTEWGKESWQTEYSWNSWKQGV
jgi:hypothetical protein